MKSIRYPNGVVLTYDDTIEVGDIVTAYQKGWHRVIEIRPRKDSTPIIVYQRLMDSTGKLVSSKVFLECDASYCQKWDENFIDEHFANQVQHFIETKDALKALLRGSKND